MTVLPDWVCEITSPGHERKDMLTHFMRLQRAGVPYYWVIVPDTRTIIAYALDTNGYRVAFSAEGAAETSGKARIPPFDAADIELGALFGDPENAPT